MRLYVCLAILLLCSGMRFGDATSQKEFQQRDLQDDNTFVPMMYATPTRIVFDNHGPSLTLSFLRRPDIFSFFGQYVEISEIELISEGLAPSFIPEYNVLQRFPLPSTEGFWNITYWNTTQDVYDPNKNDSSYHQLVQWAKFTTTINNGASVSIVYSLFSNTTKGTFPGSTNERTMPRGALHVEIKLSSWPFPDIDNTTSNSSYPRFPMASVYTKIIGASFYVSHSPDHTVNGLKMTNTFMVLYLLSSGYLVLDGDQLAQPKVGSTTLIAMYPTELRGTVIVPRFNQSAKFEIWLHPIEFEPPKPHYNPMPVIIAICTLVGVIVLVVVGVVCVKKHLSFDSELVPTQDTSPAVDAKEIELQTVSTSPLLDDEEDNI